MTTSGMSRRTFLALSGTGAAAFLLGLESNASAGRRSFQFGVVADAQYCDYPDAGTRHYRASLGKLREAAETFNGLDLDFTIHLGDIIDRDPRSFSAILPVYDEVRGPKFHLLGNHDFPSVPSDEVVDILDMPDQYYEFRRGGWRFVVLDTNDISLYANPVGSDKYVQAQAMYEELKAAGAVNAQTWNGAVGDEQMAWLRRTLARAERKREQVIVLGHMPVYPKDIHNAWNDEAIVETLESHDNVVAYLNGHNHYGNYGERNGIHYVNFHGMVELDTNAYSTVRVHPDRLEIDGYGREPDRVVAVKAEVLS
jgi:manganese-dependent ADP-ribose/CDP-alcohol diphosphatase